jgi:hypothetical protein
MGWWGNGEGGGGLSLVIGVFGMTDERGRINKARSGEKRYRSQKKSFCQQIQPCNINPISFPPLNSIEKSVTIVDL